VLKETELVEH